MQKIKKKLHFVTFKVPVQRRVLSICAKDYCAWIWISRFQHLDANHTNERDV